MIFNLGSHQTNQSSLTSRNQPVVHDRRIWIPQNVKVIGTGHKISCCDARCTRDQAIDIYLRARTEKDPIGIDQDDIAVRRQLASDLRGIEAIDAIERQRVCIWLYKTRVFIHPNIKAAPVYHRSLTVLLHFQQFPPPA